MEIEQKDAQIVHKDAEIERQLIENKKYQEKIARLQAKLAAYENQ